MRVFRFAGSLIAAISLHAAASAQEDIADLQPGDPDVLWTGKSGLVEVVGSMQAAESELLPGDLFWSNQMQFARTGILLDPIEVGWVDGFRRETAAGTPVYARQLRRGLGRRGEFAWCVVADPDGDDLLTQPTACMERIDARRMRSRFMELSDKPLTMSQPTGRRRTGSLPDIAEVEQAFAPVYTESMRYDGVANGRVSISIVRESGDVATVSGQQALRLDENGSTIVRRSGGAWRVTPAASADDAPLIERLAAPLPANEYGEILRGYLEFMVARTGSIDFMIGGPTQPSLLDMEHNGYVHGQSTLDDARALRDTALPDPLAGLDAGGVAPGASRSAGHVLLELTDAPVTASEGFAERGDVIAIHQLRARHAITIDAPLEGISRDFEAGSVFGLLALGSERNTDEAPADPRLRVWCDMTPDDRFFATSNRNCFFDNDADGQLDEAVMAQPLIGRVAMTLGSLRERRIIDPHPYRTADPSQHPLGEVGYEFCEGDNIEAPARFAPVYRAVGDDDWSSETRCSLGLWPDEADRNRVQAGALELSVTAEADGIRYAVTQRLAAEPVHVGGIGDAPEPIRTLGSRREEAQSQRRSLNVEPLVATGTATVTAGRFNDRAAFATLDVSYGATGRLLNEVRQTSGWMRDDPLPVGTPLYGVPMGQLTGNSQMIWCAPRREDEEWDTVCFPTMGQTTFWLEPSRTFYVSSLRFPTDTPSASPPEVERVELDLGYVLQLEVYLLEWDRRDADVQVRLCGQSDTVRACDRMREINATRRSDGSADVIVFGHRLRLSEPEDGSRRDVQVEILEAPDGGYSRATSRNPLLDALRNAR